MSSGTHPIHTHSVTCKLNRGCILDTKGYAVTELSISADTDCNL